MAGPPIVCSKQQWMPQVRRALADAETGAVLYFATPTRHRAEELADHFAVEINQCKASVYLAWPEGSSEGVPSEGVLHFLPCRTGLD